jgi:tRNA pseudouridine55 synthase
MKRRQELEGIVIVDKPQGITSHDVVDRVRRILHMKRVGHAGTLDPLATGVLIILVGKSTKLFNKFEPFDKAYLATLKLGVKTTTADIQGQILAEKPFGEISQEMFLEMTKHFMGEIEQRPPMVSAVKVAGERLYKLARQGIEVKRESRKIKVNRLDLVDFNPPYVQFYLECSKGTYVRQLAEDLGGRLGCGACITQIKRTKVGPFSIDESVTLDKMNEDDIRSWDECVKAGV